jgi:hypothetical protein
MTAFRETLWFKRGEILDALEGETAPVPLPIEDRYGDDGTVYATDSLRFGLHCGQTCEMPLDLDVSIEIVSVEGPELLALARELERSRTRAFAAVCASVCVVAAALFVVL